MLCIPLSELVSCTFSTIPLLSISSTQGKCTTASDDDDYVDMSECESSDAYEEIVSDTTLNSIGIIIMLHLHEDTYYVYGHIALSTVLYLL